MTSGVQLDSTVGTHSLVSLRSIWQSRVLASGHMSVFASLEEYRKFWMYWEIGVCDDMRLLHHLPGADMCVAIALKSRYI